ncbi:MAG: hypothetical protein MK105_02880 [Crocinitomicaceae bacterium]|nr:hypothetical protein [Crocinitomicaceae bacterium]
MKLILLLITLFYSSISFSQDYYEYYEGINQAKISLIEDKLEQSLNHYHRTFEQFDFVFARDCFNALEVASKVGNQNQADYFLRRCLKQGIELSFLERYSLLTALKATPFWTKILSDKDSLRQIYLQNVNWELRKEVIEMFTEDQEIRDLADKNRFNIFKKKKLSQQFIEIDRKLVQRLIQITEEYGFPGEKLIGIDHHTMHPKIETKNLTAGMPIVILIHNYSQPNQSFNSIFIDEIVKGNLFNAHFATIADFQYTFGNEENNEHLCHSKMFRPELADEIINENREQIKLLSISNTWSLNRKKTITPKYYLY